MGRNFQGDIHLRLSKDLHEELAREAFERGISINVLCAQTLQIRRVWKDKDPWKAIRESWQKSKDVDARDVERAVQAARREIRSSDKKR